MIHSEEQDSITVSHLTKRFGTQTVLDDLSFSVAKGEFLTILGSSGCGKTTLLRILCGLETADSGNILLDGIDITDTEPHLRNMNTVFQSYALFPHMTVAENIAYPLRLRKIPKADRSKIISDALALVKMQGYEDRYPAALSGGQKQRIAIARAVVCKPKVLLLDEPLGALDLNLRRQMQTELKNLQNTLGITFIYITHDQEEALNMSDRIAVLRGGTFEQLGTPAALYDTPATVAVARFVGEANILPCTFLSADGDSARVRLGEKTLAVRVGLYGELPTEGVPVSVALRGEKLRILENGERTPEKETVLSGTVTDVSFSGGVMKLRFTVAGTDTSLVTVRYGLDSSHAVGDTVFCAVSDGAGVLVREAQA